MMEDWIDSTILESCEIHDNLRKPINSKERAKRIEGKSEEELYPYYGATGQVGFIDDFLTEGDYILVGEDAAPFLDYSKDVAYKITGKTWVNNHAHILKSKCNDDFLLHYLNHFNFIGYVSGTTRLKLTQGKLKQIPITLPPLPIQRAIVSKIESLFSSLDSGIADLKKVQEQLKIYRQAVLKKAFEGELTKYKTGKESIWDIVKLDDISISRLGKMLDKQKNLGKLKPYLANLNVRWGHFDLTALKEMRFEEHEKEKYQVRKGDLIVCEGGEPGRCAVWQSDQPIFIQKALHRVRFFEENSSIFYYYYFQYLAQTGGLSEHFTGSTIKHLTGRKLKEVKLPHCAFDVQKLVVKEIESRLSVCDKVEESIKDSLVKAKALRQSILKKAFEGKLLTTAEIERCKQEADYEPASVLLDRIKKEKKK